MSPAADQKTVEEILGRGVQAVFPSAESLKEALFSGKRLTFFLGIDPTGPSLHLGHAITLMKLRQLERAGHKIILLIGDFTAMIGDPTDKSATRKQLTREEVLENMKTYREQIGLILDLDKTEFRYNGEWFGRFSAADFIGLMSKTTVSQMLERDMFQDRMKEGKPVHLHELVYPLMQGYDSVAMGVDGEVGGNDQTFNMLVGRDLLRAEGKDKFVIACKLLVDPSGKKMGKTEGNMVTLNDLPVDMYGKVMSWPDSLLPLAFELCTVTPSDEVENITADLKEEKINPRDAKMRLAREIVSIYHGTDGAEQAERSFVETFQKGGLPDEMEEAEAEKGTLLMEILVDKGIVSSKAEYRRLVDGGAVKINDAKVESPDFALTEGAVVKVGKRRFVKIQVK